MENRISIDIPEDVNTAFMSKLDEAFAIINPYMASISNEEKATLLKIGDKTTPFVTKALEYAQGSGNEFVTKYLNVDEFKKDVAASTKIDSMYKKASQVINAIDDTHALTANDAYAAALLYYQSVKTAAIAGESKAKTIYDDLSQRFPGRPKKVTTDTTSK
jgi:hypothetical protein